MKPATSSNSESEIRVLKIGTCPSLSGKSKLTYHVGCAGKGDIQFRVYGNSHPGFFSNEWVSLKAIEQVFDKIPAKQPLTCFSLVALFKGKSINTPGFLLAVLLAEGLVRPSEEHKRCHERCDPKGYLPGLKALVDRPAAPSSRPSWQRRKSINRQFWPPEKLQRKHPRSSALCWI